MVSTSRHFEASYFLFSHLVGLCIDIFWVIGVEIGVIIVEDI